MPSTAMPAAQSSDEAAASAAPRRATVLQRFWRLGSYTAWTMAALALPLVLDRLIACPILRERLGKEAFGGLMWVRSIAYMCGSNFANGFSIPFLRDLIKFAPGEVRTRMRTALVLTLSITSVVMLVVNVVCYYLAGPYVQQHAWAYFLPFTGFSLARSLEMIITVRLRVQRSVRLMFALRAVEGVILCAAAMLLRTTDILVISTIYFISTLAPMLMSAYFNRDVICAGQWWDTAAAKKLLREAPGGILSVAIDNAQMYLPIMLLGAMVDERQVAVFYAMTVTNAFVIPFTFLGQAVLNLIAGKKSFDLRGRRGQLYLGGTLAIAALVGLATALVGPFLVRWFYPHEATETLAFLDWIAVANGCASVRSLMRPIGIKFASLRTVVGLSTATLAAQVIALAVLIPAFEAKGAAMGLAISSAVGMAVWLTIFEQFRRRSAVSQVDESVEAMVEA